jgi:hypothetical protein
MMIEGTEPNEMFGSSVLLLTVSSTTAILAVGGPGYGNGAGRIRVYQISIDGSNKYSMIGNDIVGATDDDAIGHQHTFSGGTSNAISTDGIVLVVTFSKSKAVYRYDYNPYQNAWDMHYDPISLVASHEGDSYNDTGGTVDYYTNTTSKDDFLIVGYAQTVSVFSTRNRDSNTTQ